IPIKAPVVGIEMRLVKSGGAYSIFTDIQGMEDALGDMDLNVAGTYNGIAALQMDNNIAGHVKEILKEPLQQAKTGRMQIIHSMLDTIQEPRKELSPYASKILSRTTNPDKIRDVIGPNGKQINQIIDETGVKADIEQDGSIFIASADTAMN